jgi:uncharacterized protein YndB with AHSA1/START domain
MSLAIVLVIAALLAVGWMLPGTWDAEASRMVAAPPDSVFARLAAPRRWDEWTPWPDIPFRYEGPESGAGARRSWDAPEVGAGSFTVSEAEASRSLRYHVELAGERHPTRGSFRLEATPAGTHVTWREEGDFGSNPILGWVALVMRRRHPRELALRLGALAAAAEGSAPR